MKKILIPCLLLSFSSFAFSDNTYAQENPSHQNINNIQSVNSFGWKISPKPRFQEGDLEGQPRNVTVQFEADTTGRIINAKIIKSSGITNLDNIVLQAVYRARTKVYIENGIAYPVRAEQPFKLEAKDYSSTRKSNLVSVKPPQKLCKFNLDTKVYQQQKQLMPTAFQYIKQPNFYIYENELTDSNQSIQFSFKLSRKNVISDFEITKSSGSNKVDSRFILSMMDVKIQAPRKFYQFSKFQFQDEIKFEKTECIQSIVY